MDNFNKCFLIKNFNYETHVLSQYLSLQNLKMIQLTANNKTPLAKRIGKLCYPDKTLNEQLKQSKKILDFMFNNILISSKIRSLVDNHINESQVPSVLCQGLKDGHYLTGNNPSAIINQEME